MPPQYRLIGDHGINSKTLIVAHMYNVSPLSWIGAPDISSLGHCNIWHRYYHDYMLSSHDQSSCAHDQHSIDILTFWFLYVTSHLLWYLLTSLCENWFRQHYGMKLTMSVIAILSMKWSLAYHPQSTVDFCSRNAPKFQYDNFPFCRSLSSKECFYSQQVNHYLIQVWYTNFRKNGKRWFLLPLSIQFDIT